jgi:tripartite-type tricarboxylate transporter receptor subunit TctC
VTSDERLIKEIDMWADLTLKHRAESRIKASAIVVLCMAACTAVNAPLAQTYPARPVHIVTPYPPGGGGDLLARVFGDRLSRTWGQPVVVDNRPGAATLIGTELVAKAAPDGYTLLVTSDSSITSNPHLYPKLTFDPLRDLAPITQLIGSNMVMVVHPSVPVRTIADLVALAKSKPGALNYGSFGGGSQPNLTFEALKTETGISITHVPYKGLGPAMTAVLAGEVQMTMTSAAIAVGQIASGKLKALAITRADRSPLMPDLPTLKDAGYPGIDPRSWFGLWATGGTPAPIVAKIQRDVEQLIADPEFREREIVRRGYSPGGQSPEEFAAFIREDYEFKGRMIKASGIKADQ